MQLLAFFSAYPIAVYIVTLIIGLIVGSFLNVVIHRIPKMLELDWKCQCRELLGLEQNSEDSSRQPSFNLAVPNSRCPHCGHEITPLENIPVISYIFLKGKCSNCKTSISPRYPIIESVTAILSLVVISSFGVTWAGFFALVLTWFAIALTMIDIDTQLLPDNMTLPLLWLGLIANSFGLFTSLEEAVWGAIAGYMALWIVYQSFKLLTGKEGMGYGDFKFLGALGAWMGWQALPLIILLSSVVGAVIGIGMILVLGRDKSIPIPFGPYLAIAGWISLIWGEQILALYLGNL